MPAVPACFIDPLWVQFSALLPVRLSYHPDHPLRCHRRRLADRIVFDKLVQVLVFGCSYVKIADTTCGATTIRDRRNEWIKLGVFTELERIVLQTYDRMIGLQLDTLAVDGCITKAPGGGETAGKSPVDRAKQGLKRSTLVDRAGIPIGAVAAPANTHDSKLLGQTLDELDKLRPLPQRMTVHLDAAYHGAPCRAELDKRSLRAEISQRGKPAPIQAGQRWQVERTNAWGNAFNRIQRCYERRRIVVEAFISLAHAIITLPRLIRLAWTHYRWDTRPQRRP